MQIEGIDFFLKENLKGKGELAPLIAILEAVQKERPKIDEEIDLENIDE